MEIIFLLKQIFRHKTRNILMVWLLALLLSLSMSITINWLVGFNTLSKGCDFSSLGDAVLFSSHISLNPQDENGNLLPDWPQMYERLASLDGVDTVGRQMDINIISNDLIYCTPMVYSKELLNRLSFPLSSGTWPIWQETSEGIPVLLDARLKKFHTLGEKIPIEMFTDLDNKKSFTFIVAGFLSSNNTVLSLSTVSTAPRSTDFIQAQHENTILVTMIPNAFSDEYATSMASMILLPKPGENFSANLFKWRDELFADGMGDLWSMQELLQRDENFSLQWVPEQMAFIMVLLLLLLLGLGGLQSMMFHQRLRMAAVFRMLGLPPYIWGICWVLVLGVGLILPAGLGVLGSWLLRDQGLYPFIASWLVLLPPLAIVSGGCLMILSTSPKWRKVEPMMLLKEGK